MPFIQLPAVPAPPAELPSLLAKHPDTPASELFEPYRRFEATVRELFAQESGHPALQDPHVNVVPLFAEGTPQVTARARDLEAESDEEKSKYIMSLPADNRRPNGVPATATSLKEFQGNFAIFSESALTDFDWSNVVAAGSSVVNCLLPVPDKYNMTKRSLREYYHEKFCPASDVDLFLYGLTEAEAIEKIKYIERTVQDSILAETTTVRTKHAITICSQYPTRHIQIVLRIYKSVSEILTGFDIDSSGAAYDGKQVYCTPRALQSYVTQINHVDLSRRSPSYENRLSKYSHRNFEIYWSELDRSRIDPTIFDRSFRRTLGLARLLILEKLPTPDARKNYASQRREERGRPPLPGQYDYYGSSANIKENFEDEVAEWVNQEDVSSYDTFVIPYGRKYNAKKIEKLCYTRDLLLNAEWNQKKDREVYLHRHPAFFGRVEDVVRDCCGFCPTPVTDEEKEIAEEEGKIYISGEISFVKDDPGRQQIGSFNPLTDDDWTEMAYIGNTARLCQAIVDHDLEHVQDWLEQEGADPNRRDYTGRTPLHLAVTNSTAEIVQCLVDKGARLVARFADGRTALHFAAQRGDAEIVKILMDKSLANEAEEAEKEDKRRQDKAAAKKENKAVDEEDEEDVNSDEESEDDGEMVDDASSDDGAFSTTTGSFVKVPGDDDNSLGDAALADTDDDPDFYDINVISWDMPGSALHFAIVAGHGDVAKLLCQEYGADVLLPVKFMGHHEQPLGVLLALVLPLSLPLGQAKAMAADLLNSGATASQADITGITVLQRYADTGITELVTTLLELDRTGVSRAINHIYSASITHSAATPLLAAVTSGNLELTLSLLDAGATPEIGYEAWFMAAKKSNTYMEYRPEETNRQTFQHSVEQPLILALRSARPEIALELLDRGVDPDVLTREYHYATRRYGSSVLDTVPKNGLALVRDHLKWLRTYKIDEFNIAKPLNTMEKAEEFLASLPKDSWMHWRASEDIRQKKDQHDASVKEYEKKLEEHKTRSGVAEKQAAINDRIKVLEAVEAKFVRLCKNLPMDLEGEKVPPKTYPVVAFTKDYEFVPKFRFSDDCSSSRRDKYIELFEAAWQGDLDTIKNLTLKSSGDETQPPLRIAMHDDEQGCSPFSLAFLRGHYKVAAAILEIVQAQYLPKEKRALILEMGSDDGSDGGSDCESDDGGLTVYRTIVDDQQFTIDNIGQVNTEVRSDITPMTVIQWPCQMFLIDDEGKVSGPLPGRLTPLQIVFWRNDLKALKFLINAMSTYSLQNRKEADNVDDVLFTILPSDFEFALKEGHPELLAELIKQTGAGLPLEEMVKDTGIEMPVKPRYYQGLTVYGKKRTDWADAGRRTMTFSGGLSVSPLLSAAVAGSLETVEWFMSGAPLRCYLEFTQSKAARKDARLAHLSQSPGGFEGAISRWLNKDRDLALLAATTAEDHAKVLPLVNYLIKAAPQSVDAKNANGYTPLLMAAYTGRSDVAAALIKAGADQRVRDQHTYANLLHAALQFNPRQEGLRDFLQVLDSDALAQMFCERTRHDDHIPGSTPLHYWLRKSVLHRLNGSYEDTKPYESLDDLIGVVKLLVEYSGGRELGLLDSAGNTLLHSLVSYCADPTIVRELLEADALKQHHTLLRRENAVGVTPMELARDNFVKKVLQSPPLPNAPSMDSADSDALIIRPSDSFLPREKKEPSPDDYYPMVQGRFFKIARRTAQLMHELGEQYPGKRHLASLNEASDVTKRIDKSFEAKRYPVQVITKPPKVSVEEPFLKSLPFHLSRTAWAVVGAVNE